jgi:hypothetical protein
MKILKNTDVIKLSLKTAEPIAVFISPLTVAQKMDIASKTKMVKGEEISDSSTQALLGVKYCVKKIEGVFNHDGSDYSPDMIDGVLTDNAADEILGLLSESDLLMPLIMASNKNLSKIEGVEIEVNPKS